MSDKPPHPSPRRHGDQLESNSAKQQDRNGRQHPPPSLDPDAWPTKCDRPSGCANGKRYRDDELEEEAHRLHGLRDVGAKADARKENSVGDKEAAPPRDTANARKEPARPPILRQAVDESLSLHEVALGCRSGNGWRGGCKATRRAPSLVWRGSAVSLTLLPLMEID